jgi:hypothetical protein
VKTNRFTGLGYPGTPGRPVYWKDETSGEMERIVEAFLCHTVDGAPEPARADLDLLCEYFDYWINAPGFRGAEVEELRRVAPKPGAAVSAICNWLDKAIDASCDPL